MESFLFADWVVLFLGLMALGSVSGFFAGLLGIGGGTILVPGLYYTFSALGFPSDHLMHMAVGTSLAIIVPTGLSSARSHFKHGAVDFDLVKNIGIGLFIGAAAGSVVADSLSTESLKMFFATMTVLLAVLMFAHPERFFVFERGLTQPYAGVSGAGAGVIASLMGIGAASLTVPYMSLCKVNIHRAIGSSAALGLTVSIPATIGFIVMGWGEALRPPLSLGYVNVPAWAVIMVMSALVAPLGALAAHSVSVKKMRIGFAAFLVFVAIKMVSDVL